MSGGMRFFGTDFGFEDLEERDPKHFELKLLADLAWGGAAMPPHLSSVAMNV